MDIATIGSRHLLSGYSGVERGLAQVAPLLVEAGHQISVYGGPPPPAIGACRSYRGVRLPVVPHWPGKHFESLSRSAAATYLAVRAGHDLIHFQHQGPGIFSAMARMLRVPNVVTVCGLDWQRQKWNPVAQRAIRGAEQVAVRYADAIIVLSRRIQSYFRETYQRNTTYIPNGLPDIVVPSGMAALDRFGLTRQHYVLFAGRLVREKGCHDLLDAWSRLTCEMPLVIAGSAPAHDPYFNRLRQQADPSRVIFTGHLNQTAMAEIMFGCKLFVLPSYLEGMSNALLEAIAMTRPILASDICENLEVLDGHGAVFSVGSVDSLHDALKRLLNDPQELRRIETDLAHSVSNRPRWSDVARLHAGVYYDALASNDLVARSKTRWLG